MWPERYGPLTILYIGSCAGGRPEGAGTSCWKLSRPPMTAISSKQIAPAFAFTATAPRSWGVEKLLDFAESDGLVYLWSGVMVGSEVLLRAGLFAGAVRLLTSIGDKRRGEMLLRIMDIESGTGIARGVRRPVVIGVARSG